MAIVHGYDLALNHGGFVELTDGEITNFWYISSKAGAANKSKNHSFRLILAKNKDRQIVAMKRLSDVMNVIREIMRKSRPDYVGIEDYALGISHGSHYMGEIGGTVRLLCWENKIKMRLHDPISVKMFATHNGGAKKDMMEKAVLDRWGIDFSDFNPIARGAKQDRTASEDLCDAFVIAKMVWTELQLRQGEIRLTELHEKEIQVFNRVTKSYPVSLLSREWIVNDGTK